MQRLVRCLTETRDGSGHQDHEDHEAHKDNQMVLLRDLCELRELGAAAVARLSDAAGRDDQRVW